MGSRSRGGRDKRCCYMQEVLKSAFPEIWIPQTLWTPKSASTSPRWPGTQVGAAPAPSWASKSTCGGDTAGQKASTTRNKRTGVLCGGAVSSP